MLALVGKESGHSFFLMRLDLWWPLISFVKSFSCLVLNDSVYSPALWKCSRAMLALRVWFDFPSQM